MALSNRNAPIRHGSVIPADAPVDAQEAKKAADIEQDDEAAAKLNAPPPGGRPGARTVPLAESGGPVSTGVNANPQEPLKLEDVLGSKPADAVSAAKQEVAAKGDMNEPTLEKRAAEEKSGKAPATTRSTKAVATGRKK